MSITNLLPYLASILAIGITLGGLFVSVRSGYSKEAGQLQERLVTTLKGQVEAQEKKIQELERDRDRQNSIFSTIRYALKQYNLRLEIDGDFVTLSDSRGRSKITPIRKAAEQDDKDDATN